MRSDNPQPEAETRPSASSSPEREQRPAGTAPMTRRRVLLAGATAATAAVSPAALPVLRAQTAATSPLSWEPRLLDPDQARLLTRLCELLLPRTTTPGAVDAGVPEWIDLALSLADAEEQLAFLGGLGWIDRRSRESFGKPFLELPGERQNELLAEISDEHEEFPPALEAGAAFFRELKAQTLFAYFTSKTGRVEMLGLPEKVERETLHGCPHGENDEHA